MKKIMQCALLALVVSVLSSCDDYHKTTSDDMQRDAQEKMLKEATMQTGMPGISNFQERKLLKLVREMCDREGLVTYTYLENMIPTIVPGKTALGGKLTYVGVSVGFGIPYSTQYTNPMKVECYGPGTVHTNQWMTLPQADPNGLFLPASADGTWILMKNPNGKETAPQYIEAKIATFTFQWPFDSAVTTPALSSTEGQKK